MALVALSKYKNTYAHQSERSSIPVLFMGRKAVSQALKDRVPDLYYVHKLHPVKIAKYLGIKKTCVYDTLRFYRLYRTTFNPFARHSGRKPTLRYAHDDFLHDYLKKNPCAYLDEMQDAIFDRYGFIPTIPVVVRTLRRLDYTSKLVSKVALERDEVRRAVFQYNMGRVAPDADMVMFLDEASKNEKTSRRPKGRSLRGTRCVQRRCFVRGARCSILPAITLDGIVALEIIEGSVTSERFCRFLREQVVSLHIIHFSLSMG